MTDSHPPVVTRKQFRLAIIAFAILECLQICYLLWYIQQRSPDQNSPHNEIQSIRARSIELLSPDNDVVMRMESSPVEQRVGSGPSRRGYAVAIEMGQLNTFQPALRIESDPFGGPQLKMTNHISKLYFSINNLDQDTFAIASGTLNPLVQTFRMHMNSREKNITLFDGLNRPLLIVDTQSAPERQPSITIISDLPQPVQIKKHPQPALHPRLN